MSQKILIQFTNKFYNTLHYLELNILYDPLCLNTLQLNTKGVKGHTKAHRGLF
jgi:hypothetical protein